VIVAGFAMAAQGAAYGRRIATLQSTIRDLRGQVDRKDEAIKADQSALAEMATQNRSQQEQLAQKDQRIEELVRSSAPDPITSTLTQAAAGVLTQEFERAAHPPASQ